MNKYKIQYSIDNGLNYITAEFASLTGCRYSTELEGIARQRLKFTGKTTFYFIDFTNIYTKLQANVFELPAKILDNGVEL